MPKATKAAVTAHTKYNAKTYDRLYPFVPKGRKAEIQAAADEWGETLNEFIIKAIDERMERIRVIESKRPWYHTEEAKKLIKNLRSKDPHD